MENRFAHMTAKATDAFQDFGHYLVAHRKPLLTVTAAAVYAGLLLYEPNVDAHPLLAHAHEAANFIHEVADFVEQAGGTETLKTFAELTLHGYLTPYLSNEGAKLVASAPRDLLIGVKQAMEDSGAAIKKLLSAGIDRLHFLKPKDHRVFAVADDLDSGLGGLFTSDAHDDVPAEWMAGDGLVFQVDAEGAQPKVAVAQLCALGDLMSPAMAATLSSTKDSLAAAISRGEHISGDKLQAFAALQTVTESVALMRMGPDAKNVPSRAAAAEAPAP